MTGFIGAGNMANAIVGGMVASGAAGGEDIAVFDISAEKSERMAETYGVLKAKSADEIAETCSEIVIAVKPFDFEKLLTGLDAVLKKHDPLLISIAAGNSIEFISSFLSYTPALVRVMPNINARVGEAISAYCYNENVLVSDINKVESILSCFGKCLYIDESQFPIFGVLGGCAPAYAYMFIDSLAQAGVDNGMTKEEALKIAAQTVYGSAKMILETDTQPWRLADNVCSPGGTTIEGVISLQKDEFNKTIKRAVNKSFEKDKLL